MISVPVCLLAGLRLGPLQERQFLFTLRADARSTDYRRARRLAEQFGTTVLIRRVWSVPLGVEAVLAAEHAVGGNVDEPRTRRRGRLLQAAGKLRVNRHKLFVRNARPLFYNADAVDDDGGSAQPRNKLAQLFGSCDRGVKRVGERDLVLLFFKMGSDITPEHARVPEHRDVRLGGHTERRSHSRRQLEKGGISSSQCMW